MLPLCVAASGPGDYTIEGTASGDGGAPSASAMATLRIGTPTAVALHTFRAASGVRLPAGVPLALVLLLFLSWGGYRRTRIAARLWYPDVDYRDPPSFMLP